MRPSTSRILLGTFLVLTMVLGGISVCLAKTTVEDIISKPDSYDSKKVTVTGTVSNVRVVAFEVGRNTTTFILHGQSGGGVKVSASGTVKLEAGQEVQVKGVYRKVRKTTYRYFYNEIEASKVKIKETGKK